MVSPRRGSGRGIRAIIVGGIASLQPAVAGLPERVLVVRDQNVAGSPTPGGSFPRGTCPHRAIRYVSTPQPGFIPSINQDEGRTHEHALGQPGNRRLQARDPATMMAPDAPP